MYKYILTMLIVLFYTAAFANDPLGLTIAKDIIPGAGTASAILDQDAIDGFIQDGKEVIFTEKTKTTISGRF